MWEKSRSLSKIILLTSSLVLLSSFSCLAAGSYTPPIGPQTSIVMSMSQWNELKQEDKKWNVDKEDDYSILVLGVDYEGNWVKKQMDNIHIKPVANNNCPDLNIDNFSIENANLSATYSVKSKTNSPITKATVLLMDENKWVNKLNDLVERTNTRNRLRHGPT